MFRNYKRIKTHNINQFGILPLTSVSLSVQLPLHTPAGSWLYRSKQCLLRRAWQRYRCSPGSGRVSQVQEAPTQARSAGAWHRRDNGLRRRGNPSLAPLLPGWAEAGPPGKCEGRPAGRSVSGGRCCAVPGVPLPSRQGPRAGPASERPAPAPPGHSCKWPNQPDKANSPRLPATAGGPRLPAVAAAPAGRAPRSRLGYPRRAGWRRTGTRRSWPACARSSLPATRTARGA